jgi:arylsulfatase A
MTRPGAVLAAVLGAGILGCGGSSSPGGPSATPATPTPPPEDLGPPNIVLLFADDLGYGDLSSYGSTSISTPNIDALAREGALFTDFYVDAPLCAPSRAALMTGRWPPRAGVPWNPPKRLFPDEVVIAEVLRDRGYATGMLGKWHLGWEPPDMPIHHGFDYFYGVTTGVEDFYFGDQPTSDTVSPARMAERYTEEALRFIGEHKDSQPFFVYIAYHDPHLPNVPSAEFAGRTSVGAYGDVIEQLDATVGTLMDGLGEMGVDRNTLVIFTSDNGPLAPPRGSGSTGGLSGGKKSCEEGGIRVPAVMRWPARIPPGLEIREVASTLDIFPTLTALSGATLPDRKYHGEDISRLLTGEVERIGGSGIDGGREIVFWQGGREPGALRSGDWKYLRPGPWNAHPTLFDLSVDPGERRNLVFEQPERAEEMELRLQALLQQ